MIMGIPIYQVDAFANQPFEGNPAGVCLLSEETPAAWMQSVAAEINLSETAFVLRCPDGFSLRWFTPLKEVRLCGHATLASAHILWESGALQQGEPARFFTRSGLLTADRRGDWIELDFPAKHALPCDPPEELSLALGADFRFAGRNDQTYLLEVENESILRALHPDFALLERLPVRCVIVTARASTPEFDFISRFFAPAIGILEDPVTGSAHCYLASFWSARLGLRELSAYQASPRGGVLRVRLAGERVKISGHAVTVFAGELLSLSKGRKI